MKTDNQGRYSFTTLRPAPYPNSNAPAHIHITIKEPGKTAYYVDEYLFADDPAAANERGEGRGSNGVLTVQNSNGMQVAKRDIILGRNIPGYE